MLAPYGNVLHAVVILDMTSGQSRGFGFVHMDSTQAAAAAAARLHGQHVEGRPLTVRLRSEGPGQRGPDPRGPPPMRSAVRFLPLPVYHGPCACSQCLCRLRE